MKKWIVIALILTGAAFYYFTKSEKSLVTESPETKDSHEETKRPTLKETKYLLPSTAKSHGDFPKECTSSLADLSAMTAEEYSELIKDKDTLVTFLGDSCVKKLEENSVFKTLIKNSQCKILEGIKEEVEGPCLTMIFMLKAYLIADYTAGKKLSEMTSQELAANFAKMFFGIDNLTKDAFKKNLEIVNTFYEMHPSDANVLEAALGYMMIGMHVTNDTSVESRIDEILDKSLGESFKVDRLMALKDLLKDDYSGAKKSLDRLSEIYPNEAEVAYYQAAYYWKQGNRDMAETYINQAINLSKNCSYCVPDLYTHTKSRLGSAKLKDKKLFSISFGLNFENL